MIRPITREAGIAFGCATLRQPPDQSASKGSTARRVALALLLAAGPVHANEETPMIYPETRQADVVDDHFGVKVSDPYRWLETDPRQDAEVADWVKEQNVVTADYLSALPGREIFRERIGAMLDYVQYGLPVERGERIFYARQMPDQAQMTLMMRDGFGQERAVIDPNLWSDDATVALGEWAVSDDGRHVAYAVQESGTDWRTIRVLDVDGGAVMADEVQWARFTPIVWAADGSGFFYARFPKPAGGLADPSPVSNHAVYFHVLGTPQSDDPLIFADPERPQLMHYIDRTADGRYLTISALPGTSVNELTVIDLTSDDRTPRRLFEGFTAEWSVIGNEGERLFLLTSDAAERRRIMTLDLAEADPEPVEIVAEDAAVLTNAALVGDRLVATYLVDANTEVRRFRTDGTPDGGVELPGIGSAGGFSSDADGRSFYIFTSYNTPITVYRYDAASNHSELWAEPETSFDPNQIAVEQRFYTSKDGTRVPLFIVRRKGVTGPVPTLLHGYGGFGISLVPIYNPVHMAWVEQGGAVAVANIRGGGEYGRAWHVAGQFENRQNAFDDFIAAAEYLMAEGITPEDGLAIHGESNGGLLVGAVTNQRPDLFAAALPGVGVMDMLRFHLFSSGAMWIGDFGSPEEQEHFRTLLGYSPYHTIREGTNYPAILVTTADTDNRVVPGHSFKYVAALQEAEIGPSPHLLRVETKAGHGGGKPMPMVIEEHADRWAFAARWTGLTVTMPD
jgi:prolyl oligopeptidase